MPIFSHSSDVIVLKENQKKKNKINQSKQIEIEQIKFDSKQL